MGKEEIKRLQDYLQNYFLDLRTGFSLAYKDHFFKMPMGRRKIDLVFYQIKLRSLILLKIKSGKITSDDLKEFSNLAEQFEKIHMLNDENPTVGIIVGIKNKYIKVKYVFTEEFFNGHQEKYLEILPSERELEKVVGNFFSETKDYEEFFQGIVDVIKATQDNISQYVPEIESTVDYLIKSKSKDIHEIEATLDTLLNISMILDVKVTFDRLISYYYTVQPAYARSYEEIYADLVEDNGEDLN